MTLRTLGRACVALFAISSLFPVAAGVLHVSKPSRWLGFADVTVAAVLFSIAATLAFQVRRDVTERHRSAALAAIQKVIVVIPALLAAYFVAGQRVDWTVLVIGLAWRCWLLLYTLPFLAAALMNGSKSSSAAHG